MISIKECEVELTQKGDMVARLQVKASQIGKLLQTLESKSSEEHSKKHASHLSKQKSESGPPVKKPHYIDPIPPFNANKIRKSPSASLNSDASTTSKTQPPSVNTESAPSTQKDASTSEAGK